MATLFSSIVRCPRCGAVLGNRAGSFFLSVWAHRELVVRGLHFLTCGECGADWSPRQVNERDRRSIERILAEAQAQPLRCPSTGCGKLLAQIGTDGKTGQPVAVVIANRRQVVAASLVFVSCPRCRAGWEPTGATDATERPEPTKH